MGEMEAPEKDFSMFSEYTGYKNGKRVANYYHVNERVKLNTSWAAQLGKLGVEYRAIPGTNTAKNSSVQLIAIDDGQQQLMKPRASSSRRSDKHVPNWELSDVVLQGSASTSAVRAPAAQHSQL